MNLYLSEPRFAAFGTVDVESLFKRFHVLTGNSIAASNLVLAYIQTNQQDAAPEVLDTSQAAERLGVSREQVQYLCRTGRLRHARVGRLVKIKPEDISEYLTPTRHW